MEEIKTFDIKEIKITHPKLNKGVSTLIYNVMPDIDIKNQLTEIYFLEVYKPFKKRHKIIFDIGANIGMASLYLKDFADKVYAFEPNPVMFHVLKLNTAPYKNIEVINKGIYILDGKFPLIGPKDTLPQTFMHNQQGETTTQLVDSIRLDTFMKERKISHVDLIKMDIEGSEYNVTMDKSFENVYDKIDAMVGELHISNFLFPEVFLQILNRYGFKTKIIKTPEPNYQLYLDYVNPFTGFKKRWMFNFHTNFRAKRS